MLKIFFLPLFYRVNNAATFRYILIQFSFRCSAQTELEQHDLGSCKAHVIHNLIKVLI